MTRLKDMLERYRKYCIAAVALVGIYALAGFLLVPWIAQRTLVASLGETLQRPVHVERVYFNPFALSAEIEGFAIAESDGTPLLGFERLYANLQASSLFRWAWTLREISLDVPHLEVIREADGTLNLARLAPRSDAPPEPSEPAATPRLIVGELAIRGGTVHIADRVPETDFETVLGPVDIAASDLNTLPNEEGQYEIAVTTEHGSRLQWSGSVQVNPLQSSGRVAGSGPFAAILSRFLQDQVTFTLPDGRFELAFDYTLGSGADGRFFAAVDAADFAVLDVTAQHEAGSVFLTLPEARISGGAVRWPERTVVVGRVAVTGARLAARRSATGELDLLGLIEGRPGASEPAAQDGSEPFGGWSLAVDELSIADVGANLDDQGLRSPATTEIADLDLTLRDFSSADSSRFPYELAARLGAGGNLASTGSIGILPDVSLDGSVTVTNLALAAAQPYVGELARVVIEGGAVDSELTVTTSPEQPGRIEGSVSINGFELRNEALEERLIGWSALDVDALAVDLAAGSAELSEVLLSAPYVRLLIAEDRSTNFGALRVEDALAADDGLEPAMPAEGPADADEARAQNAPPLELTVGRLTIVDGSSDFTDLSLPLPFATHVTALAGELTTFATSSDEPAELDLEGQVDDYGLARIEGTISPRGPAQSMDIDVLFRNVAMPDLSPYTAQFAGRTLAEGQLDLDLHYAVDDGMLVGENGIVIADLELGERIESPDAADLPLDLAVALLTGPDGRITIDLPVSGDLDDPQFGIGSVIMGAFGNLITGLVTSPFRLLGRLIGVESEDFGEIEFEAGEAELTPPEREKLANLAEALALRPELGLVVTGVTAPEADSAALQAARVGARIDAGVAAIESDVGLIARRRQAIEADFRARLPGTPLEAVEATFTRPADPADPASAPALDESAYLAALIDQLVDAEPIAPADLAALGEARAAAIRVAITAAGSVEPARIEFAALEEVAPNDAGWIPLELDVADAG
jgi:hypothetical protein